MPLTVDSVEEEIMKEISADMDIPYSIVKDVVVNGQTGFTKHVMESGGYGSVRWPRFGVFKLNTKYMLIKKHMQGLSPVARKFYRNKIKSGLVFKKNIKK